MALGPRIYPICQVKYRRLNIAQWFIPDAPRHRRPMNKGERYVRTSDKAIPERKGAVGGATHLAPHLEFHLATAEAAAFPYAHCGAQAGVPPCNDPVTGMSLVAQYVVDCLACRAYRRDMRTLVDESGRTSGCGQLLSIAIKDGTWRPHCNALALNICFAIVT